MSFQIRYVNGVKYINENGPYTVAKGLLFALFLFACEALGQAPKVVPGEYLIKFKNQTNSVNVAGKISGKANLKAAFPDMNMYHFSVKDGQSGAVDELRNDPDVEFVEPNFILDKVSESQPGEVMDVLSADQVHAQSSTTYTQSYANVNVEQAWGVMAAVNAAPKTIVAIIDTGLDSNHRVFRDTGAMWINTREIAGNGIDDDYNGYVDDISGWNFINNSPNFLDDEGHGTHVGGIVVGTGFDIFSSSLDQSRVKIMPLKFLDANGSGTTANAIKAMYYAVNMGAKVINCSWGGSSYSKSLLDAISFAYSQKALVVSAAGNNGKNNDSTDMYPANYDVPGNFSVAATTDSNNMAYFSNFGSQRVHIASPGVYIYSTLPNGYFGSMSGTSMAAPFVAGMAAQAMREAPNMTGYQIKQLVMNTAQYYNNLSGKVSSAARINAYNLIINAKSNFSTLASQPDYTPNYKADRDVASNSSSSSGGGAGCGLVSTAISQFPKGGSPGASAGAVIVLLTLPMAIWWAQRQKAPKNQRRHDRFMMDTDICVKVGGRELVAHMNTISMGGASFSADEALDKGGEVSMKIKGPDGKEIEVSGRIVWSEANKAYGVQFANAKEGVLSSIQNWTSNLVKSAS